MKPELQERLFARHPEMFKNRHLDKTQSCMHWGLCCGDGWYSIIERVCSQIEYYCREAKKPLPVFAQAKEKYGTLRLDLDGGDSIVDVLVSQAERDAEQACEVCGDWGVLIRKGWLQTLCEKHADPLDWKMTHLCQDWDHQGWRVPYYLRPLAVKCAKLFVDTLLFFNRWLKLNRKLRGWYE